jgi:RNA polymerase sigma-70 factor (ECF subfamily)
MTTAASRSGPAAAPPGSSAEPHPELIAACRRGEREAFAALFLGTRDFVHSVALWVTADPAAAPDVTQEVFLRLLGRIRQFDGHSAFRTWLFRIVVNVARDHLRRLRRPPLAEAVWPIEPPPGPEEALVAREGREQLRRALERLPPRLRLPLVLRFAAGLSYDEIAAVLGLPPGTVASRLSRGLARLGRLLPSPAGLGSRPGPRP